MIYTAIARFPRRHGTGDMVRDALLEATDSDTEEIDVEATSVKAALKKAWRTLADDYLPGGEIVKLYDPYGKIVWAR